MRLEGKVALVAGSGTRMGRAVPLLFAQEGAKVAVAARGEANVNATVSRIKDAGGTAIGLLGDGTSEDDVKRVIAATVAEFGKLDTLYVNVGGGSGRAGDTNSITTMPDDFWRNTTHNNLRSAYLFAKYGVPELEKAGGGAIVFVAADFRVRTNVNAVYAAAKAGLIGFTQNLANELLSKNIRVNCVSPGRISVPMNDGPIAPRVRRLGADGTPEDAAFAALYLCSDEAAWITGVNLPVDGGNEVQVKPFG